MLKLYVTVSINKKKGYLFKIAHGTLKSYLELAIYMTIAE